MTTDDKPTTAAEPKKARTYRGSTIRSVRVADELWDPASAKAEANGTNASAIMVQALRDYLEA